MAGRGAAPPRTTSVGWLVAVIVLVALGLRLGRLVWQPLWWDEGYSVYFATEPLGRMLWLTAHDIHPPLYYGLLHLWTLLFGAGPLALRLLSVAIGVLAIASLAWLARVLYPARTRVAWIAALLLAVNPLHLYYSQEVRMYGLAMLLCIAATGWLWRALVRLRAAESAPGSLVLYAIFATLALYTLYYTALLIVVQALWALWIVRGARKAWVALLLTWLGVFIAYAPWLIYAVPKLVAYVAQKVTADSDRPLQALDYFARHMRAALVGHVAPDAAVNRVALGLSLAAVALLLILAWRGRSAGAVAAQPNPTRALALFASAPALGAFLLNLRLPFFPVGGERLLLFVLPFVLLLIARAADVAMFRQPKLAGAGLALLTLAGLLGDALFYVTPRYAQDDFRPIIRQAVQQGAPGDTFLATFPWMIGYWRAYAHIPNDGPTPLLPGDSAMEYGPAMEAQVDEALARGTLWFPEPLGFGSTLPGRIEAHLRATASNLENRWISETTRLTAWTRLEQVAVRPLGAAFDNGPVLAAAGVQAQPVTAANQPLALRFVWDNLAPARDANLHVNLRLADAAGRSWASRAYGPPGSLAADSRQAPEMDESTGLLLPAGTPPGVYTVTVALSDDNGLVSATVAGALRPAATVGVITATLPSAPAALAQMPINAFVKRPRIEEGLALLGASLPEAPLLAGTTAALRIAAENVAPTPPQRELYVTLTDGQGATAAEWQGWTLPDFPTALWPQAARVLVPVEVDLPQSLANGRYTVRAGWADAESGQRTPAVGLGSVDITRREASYAPLASAQTLTPAPLFGNHALLEGYTITQTGTLVTLALDWRVEQPLLPPHHIFVHADAADGVTHAQSDGPPITAAGVAPTGAWQPGEYLRTFHTLNIPPDAPGLALSVGLYNPETQVRLPVSIGGAPAGDAVQITSLPSPSVDQP